MKKKSAFTLIELLVVVAIIAILAALLFPSLAAFLERGRATDDASKLASLGKMMTLEMSDSQGSFFDSTATGDDTWPKILNRNYANKDWAPFRSPFDKGSTDRPKNKTTDPIPVSYGMNEKLFDTFEGKWKAPRSTLIMAAPAIDITGENPREIKWLDSAFNTSNVKLKLPSGNGAVATLAHGTHELRSKINVLFADGHVNPMDCYKFEDATTEKGKQQWLPDYESATPGQ